MKKSTQDISVRMFGQQMGVLFLGAKLEPTDAFSDQFFYADALQGMKILTTKNAFQKIAPADWMNPEYMTIINMIKPYLYRNRYCNSPMLGICSEEEYTIMTSQLNKFPELLLRTPSMLLHEGNTLTSTQIKYETLWNAMHTRGKKIVLPANCTFENDKVKLSWAHFGQVYGCDAATGSAVLSHLLKAGLLQRENDMVLNLTFDGMCEYERYFSNSETKEIFVVQPYNLPENDRLESILTECRKITGLTIEPVWARDHNEKIDERILRKIDRCGAVLVYVDNSRFNVGFECGYALARGKQIISIKPRLPKRPRKSLVERYSQPFDIATLNTTEYDESDWQIAARRIAARLSLAVGDEIPAEVHE